MLQSFGVVGDAFFQDVCLKSSCSIFSTTPDANKTNGTTVIWYLQHHTSCQQDCWYYCHLVSSAPYQLLTRLLVLSSDVFSTILLAHRTGDTTIIWCLQQYQLLIGLLVLLSSGVFSTIPVANRTAGTTVIWCLQHHTSSQKNCWYYMVSSETY